MIQGLVMLVVGQLVGEAIVAVSGLPVPGAVVGRGRALIAARPRMPMKIGEM